MKKTLYFLMPVLIFLATDGLAGACDTACPLPHASPWDRLAEKSFGLPGGLGAEVMTAEEWGEQKEIMFGMSPLERQDYKKSMRRKLIERAEEKGIAIPAVGKARELKKERDTKRPPIDII